MCNILHEYRSDNFNELRKDLKYQKRAMTQTQVFNPEGHGFDAPELLLAASAFKKIAGQYGKSTPELRDCVRKSTNLFLHYIIDGCVRLHQNADDDERQVSLKAGDIIRVLESSGFISISRKCIQNSK